jgi:hypothetical protein
MKAWQRASRAWVCGSCANIFDKGTPQLLIYVPLVKDPKRRCQTCAGEPVPADLPDRAPITTVPTGTTPALPFASVGSMAKQVKPFDYKAAQSGEREPGEDDV